jgi:alpha-beta hydrolase superfamily lysophospholipase
VPSPEIRQYEASDGYRFHYRHWDPAEAKPRAYIVALHGIQSHSGWYEYSSGRLAERGYDVSFLDRRGSGLNEVLRGHAPHPERLMNDVVQFLVSLRYQREKAGIDAPVVLLAVSWGARLATATCARRGDLIDALALLYPGICSRVRPRFDQDFMLRTLAFFDIKWRKTAIPLNEPELFTAEPHWQEYIRNDPLMLREATIGMQRTSRALDKLAAAAPEQIRCPLLVMLSGRDRIADNRATRRYIARFASSEKKVLEFENAAHTLEFEPDRDRFIDDLLAWLDAVVSTARPANAEAR